jgi:hypothetical protein
VPGEAPGGLLHVEVRSLCLRYVYGLAVSVTCSPWPSRERQRKSSVTPWLSLAFSVRSRRAGPSLLSSASARRRGRGTCPGPRPALPRALRPAPRGPGPRWRGSPDSTTMGGRERGRAPPLPLQPRSTARRRGPAGHGSTRHVTRPPCGAHTGPGGPVASPAGGGHVAQPTEGGRGGDAVLQG